MVAESNLIEQLEIPATWERRAERWKQLTVYNDLLPILRHAVQYASLQQVESELERWHEEFVAYQNDPVKIQWEIVQKWLICAQIAALDSQTVEQFPSLLSKLDSQIELPDVATYQSAIEDPAIWSQFVRQTIYRLNQKALHQTIWACDVIAFLTGHPRPVAHIETIPVLLRSSDGEIASLTLELLADEGMGIFYPNPSSMSFVTRNREFQQAEENAISWVRSQGFVGDQKQFDMRWSVTRRTGRPLDRLEGGSLGGSFALGLAKAWLHLRQVTALAGLKDLDLSGTAITAEINPTGNLSPVAGEHEKLIAAVHKKSFPRIHTIVVSKQQVETEQESHHDFVIHRLDTMREVVRTLVAESQTRWKGTDCTLSPRNPDFVGREHLFKEVQNFITDHESGYLCITGMRGSGKSAFLAEFIYRSRDQGDEPVYHIIDKSNPATSSASNIATCLYDRLRRKYTLLEPPEWEKLSTVDKLKRLLQVISQDELKDSQKEILYIDGAEQMQGTAKQPVMLDLLGNLPPGVICIMIAQPKINGLETQSSTAIWDIHEFVDDRTDVRSLLLRKQEQLPQNWRLTNAFIEQIVSEDRSPNFETVNGCLYQLQNRNERESKKEWLISDTNPWLAPPGHTGLIQSPRQQLPDRRIMATALTILLTAFFAIAATLSEPFRDFLPYEIASLFVPESCDGSQAKDAPLILIFDFDKPEESPRIYDRIEKRLYDRIAEMQEGIKVCHVEKKFNSGIDARKWGEKRRAMLVVWGSVRGILESGLAVTNRPIQLSGYSWPSDIAKEYTFQHADFPQFMEIIARLGLSKTYYADGNFSKSRDVLNTLWEQPFSEEKEFLQYEDNRKALAQIYYYLGSLFHDGPNKTSKNYYTALEAYKIAHDFDPKFDRVLLRMGNIYWNLQEYSLAKSTFTKIIDSNSSNKEMALVNRALIEIELENLTAATVDLFAAVKLAPDNSYNRFLLGMAQIQMGQTAEAEETFQVVLCYASEDEKRYFIMELEGLQSKQSSLDLAIRKAINLFQVSRLPLGC